MGLLFRHPRIPSCAACQKYVVDYDFATGQGSGQPEKAKWTGDPEALHERQPVSKPPCHVCPKRGPEFEYRFELSGKNIKTFKLWQGNRATYGRGLSEEEAKDPILRRNFWILDSLFESASRERGTQVTSEAVASAMSLALLKRS